jgi:hypothetical protein
MSGIYAGAALGGLGGFAAEHWGWRAGFSLFGGIGVGYALVLILLLKDAQVDLSHVFQFAAAALIVVGLLLLAVHPRATQLSASATPILPKP